MRRPFDGLLPDTLVPDHRRGEAYHLETTEHTHIVQETHTQDHIYKEADSKPQSSVLAIESACEFSCRQHEQPCRIVDKEKYRLSHSKRRLYKKKKKNTS